MRSSVLLTAPFAAAAFAQSSVYTNPFTSYLTETNSLGVVTGMPPVATSQAVAVTSEPAVVTSQEAAATSPAGTPAYTPPAAVGTAYATGSSSNGSVAPGNGTFVSGKPSTIKTKTKTSGSTSTETGSSSGSTTTDSSSGSGSSSSSSPSPSKSSSASAGMLEPFIGLGLAAGLFAAFL